MAVVGVRAVVERIRPSLRKCDLTRTKNPKIQDPDTIFPVGAKPLVSQRTEPTLWRSSLWPSTFVVTILDCSKKPVTIATIIPIGKIAVITAARVQPESRCSNIAHCYHNENEP
jgi:hypothetical protein